MATSNAIGTGRNAETSATSKIPPTVTCATSAFAGSNSTTTAPSTAASIISGNATRNTYQKLLAYDRAVLSKASRQVSETAKPIGHDASAGCDCSRDAASGTKTRIRNRTVASLSNATEAGNSAKVIARTTTFSAGEANIAASTDSVLMPDANNPRAIGATQFVHTARGTPVAAPISRFSQREFVRRRRSV